MAVHVRSVATAVPPTVLHQSAMRDLLLEQSGVSRLARRLISAAFDSSEIETRASVLTDLDLASDTVGHDPAGDAAPLLRAPSDRTVLRPGTGARNAAYATHAPPLAARAARDALREAGGLRTADVTHVVTASCTGFFAPGPDYRLVRDLDLSPATRRLHVGFMGCCAAFPALAAARATCAADPDAVVLVVCVELCSLHLHVSDDPDTIVASSVFADGAAAAVVTARPAPSGHAVLELDAMHTTVTPVGEQDMAWTIGDHGFDMVLSRYVPAIIGEHIRGALGPALADVGGLDGAHAAVPRWAVHPGGRSVLDKVQAAVGLTDEQIAPSRAVLREHGNMSSATVLFILQRLLAQAPDVGGSERVCAMAFGPGLTVESALLTLRRAG